MKDSLAFWITIGRSLFAMALGVAVLFWPDPARALLSNFIGGFWIAGSLLTIRWGFANEKSKVITLLVGGIGAIAGLALAGRSIIDNFVAQEVLFVFLGIVAILTGLLHISGHMQIKRFTDRGQTRSGTILGIAEILIGLIVLFTPWQDRALINILILVWAMVSGVVILLDALAMRREAKKVEESSL